MRDKDYNLKEYDIFIIKNNKMNEIKEDNLIKEYNYNKLKNVQSFQGIQDLLRQQRRRANINSFSSSSITDQSPLTGTNQSTISVPTLTNSTSQDASLKTDNSTNVISNQKNKDSSLQGMPISFRQRLWGSPRDYSGVVYQFNRGAIGISADGKTATFNLDHNNLHHSDATRLVSSELGFPFVNPNSTPFNAGLESAQNEIVLIQLEGAAALIYLPNDGITQEQQSNLEEIMKPRQNFEISFTHLGQIYADDNVTLDSLLQYTSSYIQSSVKVR